MLGLSGKSAGGDPKPVACVICARPVVEILGDDTQAPDGATWPALTTLYVSRGPQRGVRLCACRLCIIEVVCNFSGAAAALRASRPPEPEPPPRRHA